MIDSTAFVKIHPDDFSFYIQLLDAKMMNVNAKFIKYKNLVDTYTETEKHKSFLKQLWETFSFKNFESYHDYLWNEHEMGTLYNKKQRIKNMLDWFIGLERPIYISVEDYKFILDEEDT